MKMLLPDVHEYWCPFSRAGLNRKPGGGDSACIGDKCAMWRHAKQVVEINTGHREATRNDPENTRINRGYCGFSRESAEWG